MKPSAALEALMRYHLTQELCDEIDDVFRAANRLSNEVKRLEEDMAFYSRKKN